MFVCPVQCVMAFLFVCPVRPVIEVVLGSLFPHGVDLYPKYQDFWMERPGPKASKTLASTLPKVVAAVIPRRLGYRHGFGPHPREGRCSPCSSSQYFRLVKKMRPKSRAVSQNGLLECRKGEKPYEITVQQSRRRRMPDEEAREKAPVKRPGLARRRYRTRRGGILTEQTKKPCFSCEQQAGHRWSCIFLSSCPSRVLDHIRHPGPT